MEELDNLLDLIKEILPLSATQWEEIAKYHLSRYPDKNRSVDSLKRKFKELNSKKIPTGDPHCPQEVRRAKRIRRAIIDSMDASELNSRTDEEGSGTSDDSDGELSNGSSQDYDDIGNVIHPPGRPGDEEWDDLDAADGASNEPPTGGEEGAEVRRGTRAVEQPASQPPSRASGGRLPTTNRRRTAAHLTPIARPRYRQRRDHDESPPDRVDQMMAMMMMNQSADREERQEEQEERRQEFRLQVDMQRQQMQAQQNMMTMLMISMLGRSPVAPSDGTGAATNNGTGEGGNNNDTRNN
jgi:hypothetical protein